MIHIHHRRVTSHPHVHIQYHKMRGVSITDSNVPENVDGVVCIEEATLLYDIRNDTDAWRAQIAILRTKKHRLELCFFFLFQVKHDNHGTNDKGELLLVTHPNA